MTAGPAQRSLKLLRDRGYTAQVVEKWIPQAKRRVDLFGVIDIVAIKEGESGVLGVQSTSYSNTSSRLKKARESDKLPTWLAAGNRFVVHGWRKVKHRWVPREVEIEAERN